MRQVGHVPCQQARERLSLPDDLGRVPGCRSCLRAVFSLQGENRVSSHRPPPLVAHVPARHRGRCAARQQESASTASTMTPRYPNDNVPAWPRCPHRPDGRAAGRSQPSPRGAQHRFRQPGTGAPGWICGPAWSGPIAWARTDASLGPALYRGLRAVCCATDGVRRVPPPTFVARVPKAGMTFWRRVVSCGSGASHSCLRWHPGAATGAQQWPQKFIDAR